MLYYLEDELIHVKRQQRMLSQGNVAMVGYSDGSGSKQFGPGWVNFLWLGLGQPSMVWVWKISPRNVKCFNFFHFRSKKSLPAGSKSTRVKGGYFKSKLRSGQGPSLGQDLSSEVTVNTQKD